MVLDCVSVIGKGYHDRRYASTYESQFHTGDYALAFTVRHATDALRVALEAQVRELHVSRPRHLEKLSVLLGRKRSGPVEAIRVTRHHGYSDYEAWRICLPRDPRLAGVGLAALCQGWAGRYDIRVNTLRALNHATWSARRAVAPTPKATRDNPESLGHETLPAIAAVQAIWAAELDKYLALDVASDTCRHPELVRELHLGRTPLEFALLSRVMRQQTWRKSNPGMRLLPRLAPNEEFAAAGKTLESAGWLEDYHFDFATTGFRARPGAKMRKLQARDLLDF